MVAGISLFGKSKEKQVWGVNSKSSVLKPWNRMVFITHKQSLEDFLLEISFHEKLKILSFRYRH